MNTEMYATDLRGVINSKIYTSLVCDLGPQLNSRKDLMDKADIIEQTVEIASNYRLEWVDQIGYDYVDSKLGYKVEFKFISGSRLTKKLKKEKLHIRVRIKNSRHKSKDASDINLVDYYVIGQENAIAVISGEDLKQYLTVNGDGVDACIPYSALSFVFKDVSANKIAKSKKSYKDKKRKLQKDHIMERVKMLGEEVYGSK